jgi:hypothetical protein
MNLNLKPRMGNGTFRASSWPYGSPGSYLGDISPAEIQKRANEYKMLVARDFPGYGKADYAQEGRNVNWFTTKMRNVRPYAMSAVQANSANAENLKVIVHNTKLWKTFVGAYAAQFIHRSGLVFGNKWFAWEIDNVRTAMRNARAEMEAEADAIIAQAEEYMKPIGVQKNVEATPDVVVQPVIDKDGKTTNLYLRTQTLTPIYQTVPGGAAPASSQGGLPGWLLPIGAGAAAYFMLKG